MRTTRRRSIRRVLELGIPTLGICYGAQLLALELGGAVERTGTSEFGKTSLEGGAGTLFEGLPEEQTVWMSHRDTVTAPPAGATVTGRSAVDAGGRVRGPGAARSTACSSIPR